MKARAWVVQAVGKEIERNRNVRAYDLWQWFDPADMVRLREVADAIEDLKEMGALPADFQLKGLRACPFCHDDSGRHWVFARRKDKVAHMVEHARYFPDTLPKFTRRWKQRQANKDANLGRLFA